jgi:hypothetical protein
VVALIADLLAVAFEKLDVRLKGGRDGHWSGEAGSGVRTLHMKRTRRILCLLEIEDGYAVTV